MDTAKLGKYEVKFDDSVEFHTLKREIWGSHQYYIELDNESPRILDLGSHIGLSTLYFKTLFPASEIDSYEPHPDSFRLLKENLEWNNIQGVTIHNEAASVGESSLTLHVNEDNTWRSTVSIHPMAWNESQHTIPMTFRATPFRQIISAPYDLVKMDVEGYEYELIKSVKNELNNCKHWLIEIHGRGHYDVRELIAIFEKQGFTTRLEKSARAIKPHQLSGLALLHADYGDAR